MKFFRHLFFVWITVMILPQVQGHSLSVQQVAGNNIHVTTGASLHAAVKSPRFQETVTRFKRRPVGINDGYCHEKVCPVFLAADTARFVYVDKILKGYYYNPYLSVPIPLRSWRGPPTA